MYSGFVTHRHAIKRIGVHQRLDMAAYRMARHYFAPGSFPPIKQILHFEGANGPDGLKVKSPTIANPDHFYDPETKLGELPLSLERHYKGFVLALQEKDQVKAAFEASWLAHFVVDGLTPAHHQLPGQELEDLCGGQVPVRGQLKFVATGKGALKKNWAIWVERRIIPAHQNFEIGIAATLLGRPVRTKLDPVKLAQARELGYMKFFEQESLAISKLDLYTEFREKGWTSSMAASVRNQIAPAAVQAVGIVWLLAYLEAGLAEVKQLELAAVA